MDFKKLFGLPLAFIVLLTFGLASCFSTTDYERAPQVPGEPQEQQGIRVFNGEDRRQGNDERRIIHARMTNILDPNLQNTLNEHSFFTSSSSGNMQGQFINIYFAFVPSSSNQHVYTLFNNFNTLIRNPNDYPSNHQNAWLPPIEIQIQFLQQHLFIGRYSGLSHTKLTNSFGNEAIIDNNSTAVSQFREMHESYSHYHMYIIIVNANAESRPSWTGTHPFFGDQMWFSIRINIAILFSLLGANYISTRPFSNSNHNTRFISRMELQPNLPSVSTLPDDLQPSEPDIPDDNDIVPDEPEVPGDDGNDNEPGTDEDQDNGDNGNGDDNGYEPTPEVTRQNWWQQFAAWLRRWLLQ